LSLFRGTFSLGGLFPSGDFLPRGAPSRNFLPRGTFSRRGHSPPTDFSARGRTPSGDFSLGGVFPRDPRGTFSRAGFIFPRGTFSLEVLFPRRAGGGLFPQGTPSGDFFPRGLSPSGDFFPAWPCIILFTVYKCFLYCLPRGTFSPRDPRGTFSLVPPPQYASSKLMQNPKHKDAIYTQKNIKRQNTSGGQFENTQSKPPYQNNGPTRNAPRPLSAQPKVSCKPRGGRHEPEALKFI